MTANGYIRGKGSLARDDVNRVAKSLRNERRMGEEETDVVPEKQTATEDEVLGTFEGASTHRQACGRRGRAGVRTTVTAVGQQ